LEGKEGGEMETKALKRREEWEKVEGRGRKGKRVEETPVCIFK